jgi:predicted transcriptional regulator
MTELRDIDQTILHHIQNGHNDTQKITSKTTIKTHRVRYSLEKLQQQGLITVEQPDQMVERVVDGQKRVFQHPKQAQLTDKGHQYLKQSDKEDLKTYQDMSHKELVKNFRELDKKVDQLERSMKAFRRQIQGKLN